ncbi:MAG: GDYXXLXY domain-containing protein [Planctomycetota bacterium]|nr:GDYXXLXY domain-containing protein [Planctomycetota bacterium]
MSTNNFSPSLPPWKDPAKIGLAIFTAFVFQLVILSGLSGKGLVPRITSDRVRFEVIPVDPRDMMRGEYIILGYEFSRLPEDVALLDERIKSYKTDTNFKQKSIDVYVTLKFNLKEDVYKGIFFGSTPPTKGRYLRGKLNPNNRIEFGIEAFYLQEGKGRIYEQAIIEKKLVAEVYLSPDGSAQMKQVHIIDNNKVKD